MAEDRQRPRPCAGMGSDVEQRFDRQQPSGRPGVGLGERLARPSRYSPEVRERAVRMVREHGAEHPSQWAAIASIASKLGCTAETLRRWVRQAERDTGQRAGLRQTSASG